jgi:L-ascorbate metabolism protein UlaG (beta-lactamase superfamily)
MFLLSGQIHQSMNQRSTYNPSLPFIKDGWTGNPLNQKNQYINLDGSSERSFAELFKWQTEKNPLKPLKKKQNSSVEVLHTSSFAKNINDGFTWLGHATFLFTLEGKYFITDPVFYGLGPIKRFTPLPCGVSDLKNIDFILLSHNHRDHADKKSMQQLCAINPNAIILTGLEIGALLRSWKITNPIIEAGWYQQFQLDADVTITYLPAKHWNRRGVADMNEMLWGSFMLQSKTHTIYFGADSGLGIHFEEISNLFPSIDFAMLGIGAYKPEWFMHTAHTSPADVLVAHAQLGSKQLIPMHHGTFDLSDEPIFYPKQELLLLQEQQGIETVHHLAIGKKLEI